MTTLNHKIGVFQFNCHNFIISTQIIDPSILGLRCHKFIFEIWCLSCLNCDSPLGGRNIEDGAFLGLLLLQLLKGETCGPRIIFQLSNWHLSSIEEKYFPPRHLLALCSCCRFGRGLYLFTGHPLNKLHRFWNTILLSPFPVCGEERHLGIREKHLRAQELLRWVRRHHPQVSEEERSPRPVPSLPPFI